MTKTLDTEIEFAELFRVDSKTNTLISFGGADSKSKKSKTVAETTNEAYTLAADAVLTRTTGTFAKLFAENPVK